MLSLDLTEIGLQQCLSWPLSCVRRPCSLVFQRGHSVEVGPVPLMLGSGLALLRPERFLSSRLFEVVVLQGLKGSDSPLRRVDEDLLEQVV